MSPAEAIEALPFIDGLVFGEGPRWHDGRLWFTDGAAGRVYSVDESGDLTVEGEIDRASGLGWLPDGTLLVSTLFASKVHKVDAHGNVTETFDFSDFAQSTNDLLVTPDGRTYVDLYSAKGDAIALVGDDGSVDIVATGLSMPNGLALLPGGSTLVVSETRGSRILAYPLRADGSLGPPSRFAYFGPDRHPDGLCVDVQGGVWVGCADSREFIRVLAGGAVTHRISIEQGWAIAPALGGPDGRTLYMVVDDTTAEGILRGESTGWVMRAHVDVPGDGSP